MGIERRAVMRAPELRADGNVRTIGGYAAVFNSETNIGDWWVEKIAPGAFAGTLNDDIRALWDHNSARIVGRTTNGTLRLREDERGLAVEIDLPDTSDGRDLATLVERGDITGMSFGFEVTRQSWDETGRIALRTIEEVKLFEVSAVAFPAYEETELALRSSRDVKDVRHAASAQRNAVAAAQRIALRKAQQDQRFRGLGPASRK